MAGPIHTDIPPLLRQSLPEEIGLMHQQNAPLLIYHQEAEMVTGDSVEPSRYVTHSKPQSLYSSDVEHLMQVEEDHASVAARQLVDEATCAAPVGHRANSSSSPLVSPVNRNLPQSPPHTYPISPLRSVTSPPHQFERATPRVHPQPSRTSSVPTNVNRPTRRRKSKTSLSSSPTRTADPYPQQKQPALTGVPQVLQRSRTEPSLPSRRSTSSLSDMALSSPVRKISASPRGSFVQMPRSSSGNVGEHHTRTHSSVSRPVRSSYPGIAPKMEVHASAPSGIPTSSSAPGGLMSMNDVVQFALQSLARSTPVPQISGSNPPAHMYAASGATAPGPSATATVGHPPPDLAAMIQRLVGALSEAPELLPKILDVVESHKKGQQTDMQSQGSGYVIQQPEPRVTSPSTLASQHQPYTIPLQEAQIQVPQGKKLNVQGEPSRQDFFSQIHMPARIPGRQQSAVSPPSLLQSPSPSSTPVATPVG